MIVGSLCTAALPHVVPASLTLFHSFRLAAGYHCLTAADTAVVRWIASRLMYPRTDTPQAQRMMALMNSTNVWAGQEITKAIARSSIGSSGQPCRLMEIGFGGGQAFRQTADLCAVRNWKILGVDHSEDSLAFTKRALTEGETDPSVYQLLCADISSNLWAFPDNSFDCIYHVNTWYAVFSHAPGASGVLHRPHVPFLIPQTPPRPFCPVSSPVHSVGSSLRV